MQGCKKICLSACYWSLIIDQLPGLNHKPFSAQGPWKYFIQERLIIDQLSSTRIKLLLFPLRDAGSASSTSYWSLINDHLPGLNHQPFSSQEPWKYFIQERLFIDQLSSTRIKPLLFFPLRDVGSASSASDWTLVNDHLPGLNHQPFSALGLWVLGVCNPQATDRWSMIIYQGSDRVFRYMATPGNNIEHKGATHKLSSNRTTLYH